MADQPDISIIITAHAEKLLAGVTARSALAAAQKAADHGLRCEFVVVLDNADDITSGILRNSLTENARFLETREGDPGLSRNRGVDAARGRCATFLDADDLWSENWLVAAHELVARRPDAILHSACNVDFGNQHVLWWHTDSESPLCDLAYLEWMNFWDAMAFARTDILRAYPFTRNDMRLGYGHEDWHWNKTTIAAGIPHKPVPGTLHFKRKRSGSQSGHVDRMGGVPWPTATPDRRMIAPKRE